MSRSAAQIAYPFSTPIISAFSKGYYWSQPVFNLMGAPVLEEHSLLGLPDLFHELGHVVLFQCGDNFLADFRKQLHDHYSKERRNIRDEQKPQEYEEIIVRVQEQWKDEWTSEFASDMIATFLVGSAYGWANLRLCSSSLSDDVFWPGPTDDASTHPSDDARTKAIIDMLNLLGLKSDAAQIEERWHDYVRLTNHSAPFDYALCYPAVLLEKLAKAVFIGCAELGLKPFTSQSQMHSSVNIPILLNEAWQEFLKEPEKYPNWEANRLSELRRGLVP